MNPRLVLILLILCAINLSAQNTGTGTPNFGSFTTGTKNDIINNQNLNIHFTAPLSSQKGRGPLNFHFEEIYDSQIWLPVPNGGTTSWTPVLDSYGHQTFGWQTGMPTGNISESTSYSGTCVDSSSGVVFNAFTENNFTFTDPLGTRHLFPGVTATMTANASGFCVFGGNLTGYAGDASGYYIEVNLAANPPVVVHAPNGIQYLMNVSAVDFTGATFFENIAKDTNGNFITGQSDATWTNTDGHAWRGNINPINGNAWLTPNQLSYEGVTINLQAISIQTSFGCPGVAEYTGTANVPATIVLGNGLSYTFTYELTPGSTTTYTGRLKSVTLPTGGTYQYDYPGAHGGINCADGTTMAVNRTINDGNSSQVWSFARNGTTTTITAPKLSYDAAGNDTVLTFDANGHEISRKIYQGSAGATPLSVINTTWATNGTPATVTTILEDGSTQAETDTTYSSNGILQAISFYDFGNGAHGPLLKSVSIAHLSDSNSNYSAPRNLIDRISEVQIRDGSGTIQSRTHTNYDEGSLTSCTASVSQHDDSHFGCSFTFRGNPTSVLSYKDAATPANPVIQGVAYDMFGNAVTVSTNGIQQKSYTYAQSSLFVAPVSVTSGPSTGPQLTQTYSYTGLPLRLTSTTDANGLSTTYTVDTFGRVNNVTLPDGSQVSYGYDDVNRKATVTQPIDSTHSLQTLTVLDILGRPLTTTTQDASGNVLYIVQNRYDELGRLSGTSNPYVGNATPVFTNTRFDALGRVTKTILPDGQQTTNTYALQTLTVTDPASKQVRTKTDALGRVVETDLPGGSSTAATPGAGSATINGTERSVTGAAATPGTGSVSYSGTEQSKPGAPATAGSVSLTITGTEASTVIDPCADQGGCITPPIGGGGGGGSSCPRTVWDSGTVSVTVNGFSVSASYGSSSTGATIASALASAFNGNSSSPVTASASSATLTLVSKATGTASNYAFSSSSSTSDPTDFGGPSFAVSPVSGSLAGGANQGPPIFDSGTCSATINGTAYSTTFGQSDTTSTIASRIATAISAGTLVSATASGATVSLTAKTTGSATNYSLTATCSYNSSSFTSPSFTASTSGTTLTGGTNAGATVFDSGTVSLTVNGTTVSATYGSSSTTASIASALASALNSSSAQAQATVSGSTINMVALNVGAASNYSISTSSATNQPGNFTGSSFSASLSGSTFTGGANATTQSLSSPVATTYTYNVLDKIVSVTSGQQSKTYGYNALGWMTSTTMPEIAPGSLTFTYNDFGLKTQATDARGVITNFAYDSLNRLTAVTYNTGTTGVPTTPNMSYTYGTSTAAFNNGKLVTMSDGTGSETYTYDKMGRKVRVDKVLRGVTYTIGYAYNLAGETTQITYPSGRQVNTAYDGVGRLAGLSGTLNAVNTTYASGFGYNTAQQVTQFTYGNNVGMTLGYSSDGRQQLTSLRYTAGTQTLFGLNYGYLQNGGNNGQITSITDVVDNGRSVNYIYDGLAQLQQAYTNGSATFPRWDLAFIYDQYRNRTDESAQSDTSPSASVPSSHLLFSSTANTNKIISAGYAYDGNGNTTNDGVNTHVYDAANQLVSSNSGAAAYSYDGNGLRVQKCGASCASASTIYIFSQGTLIAEYDNGSAVTSPSREYINLSGSLLAKIEAGATQYYLSDHLSVRGVTDASGNKIGERGHFPNGENWYTSGTDSKFQFTSYERDLANTGNDYAIARYYINRLGRFNALDAIDNKPLLNRYIYAMNDPINNNDPQGAMCSAWVHIFDTCGNGGEIGTGIGMTCVLDGVETPCSQVLGIIDSGLGAQCPNNDCKNGTLILGADDVFYNYQPTLYRFQCSGTMDNPTADCKLVGVEYKMVPNSKEDDFCWWCEFWKSFFTDFSLKSARNPGESFSDCVSRVRAAGGSFTTAVDAVSGVGAVTYASTASLGSTTYTTGLWGVPPQEWTVTSRNLSFAEAGATSAMARGLISPGTASFVGKVAAPVAKVSGVATAVSLGLEGGVLGACR